MFARRTPHTRARWIANFFWPESGLRRFSRYLGHRVARMPGSPWSIAAGFACGAAISMTPLVGLHIALAVLIAWVIGANMVAAAFGTVVGNPWTFPFIWIWTLELGSWIVGSGPGAGQVDFAALFGSLLEDILSLDMSRFYETSWPVLKPMLVGGGVMAVLTWLATCFLLLRLIRTYQERRKRRHAARRVRDERREARG